MRYLTFILPSIIAFLPIIAAAAGLVPCGGPGEPDCTTQSVTILTNTLITFLFTMLSVIAVIVLVYAGFTMLTSGGDVSAAKKAKSMFTNVVIGIIIILASWLVIDTILAMLTGKGLSYWSLFNN